MILLKNTAIYILIIFIFLIYLTGIAFPIDMDNIVAYPVPFNPKIHTNIRIGYKPGLTYTGSINRIKLEIYDINGDRVFTRDFSSLSVIWNGRNSKGKLVKPGLYIIKISLEDTNTGDYAQKMIRILVNR